MICWMVAAPMRDDATTLEVMAATRAAGRFQLVGNAHLSQPNREAFERDGQALMDALRALGFHGADEAGISLSP